VCVPPLICLFHVTNRATKRPFSWYILLLPVTVIIERCLLVSLCPLLVSALVLDIMMDSTPGTVSAIVGFVVHHEDYMIEHPLTSFDAD